MSADPVEPIGVATRNDQRTGRAVGKLAREAMASTRDRDEAAMRSLERWR